MSDFIDGDDVRVLAQGAIYLALGALVILGLAATAGLAWAVFRLTGGL